MLYLGTASSDRIREAMHAGEMGCIVTPRSDSATWDHEAWAWVADNGCFTEHFDRDTWAGWLSRKSMLARTQCLFATLPDVVGDPEATYHRSLPEISMVRGLGYRAAWVSQDGLHPSEVPWQQIQALFVGGTDDWKTSAMSREVVEEALWRGKWVHMGRVNGLDRARLAYQWGCHSVDGTFLAFGPDVNLPRVRMWMDTLRNSSRQVAMF